MRIDILTFFPEMFEPLRHSIVQRAVDAGVLELNFKNIRDYTGPKHGLTDDKLYGGGSGMVMKPEPLFDAIEDLKHHEKCRVVITSPAGKVFNQKIAEDLAQAEQVIFICGHYEGIDQRVEDTLATDVLSIGDFVLTGGEMPAMIMADSVIRLLPGALGHDESAEEESFSTDGLLEYPQYTRPPEFRGMQVPEVLLSGDHEKIRKWRREQSLKRTYERRPELLEKAVLNAEDHKLLAEIAGTDKPNHNVHIALVHYPVYNKKHEHINTSLTNLDLHDIARAATTFGLGNYYIVQPAAGQKELINSLLKHWKYGFGARYNPDRHEALSRVQLIDSLEETIADIEAKTGKKPKLIGTSAQCGANSVAYSEMRRIIKNAGDEQYLIIFGTGWGLTDEMLASCDHQLMPIYGAGPYNHLSVRSAVSVILDRLFGEKN
ncbi:MAG: tRNA (guanosine(37)-N1)-methyltransferase TrmD [Peptococcaceae bacterium]|nr:tRNA (guanosine(37)-N1)-methyltransferase TrmD [Peptococcaceae bacterium]